MWRGQRWYFDGMYPVQRWYHRWHFGGTSVQRLSKTKTYQSNRLAGSQNKNINYYRTSTQPFLIAVTTACVRSFTFIFCKMLDTWFLTVFSEMNNVSPIVRFDWPSVNN